MEGDKKRNPNFTPNECSVLLDLVEEHKNILECKRTDASARYEKERAWDEIALKFNEQIGENFREKKVLKVKFENLKKNAKKRFAEEKRYTSGTGGGPCLPNSGPTQIEKKVEEIIGKDRIEGLPAEFDNDAVEPSAGVSPIEEEVEVLLDGDILTDDTFLEIHDHHMSEVFTVEDLRRPKSFPLISEKGKEKLSQQNNTEKPTTTASVSCKINEKRKVLHRTKPYKKTGSEKGTWDVVGEAKQELIEIQKDIAKEELQIQRIRKRQMEEEHEVKMKLMKEDQRVSIEEQRLRKVQMEEEHKIKMEMLREDQEFFKREQQLKLQLLEAQLRHYDVNY